MEEIKYIWQEFGSVESCEAILRALPDWFGLEHAIVEYVETMQSYPILKAVKGDEVIGFTSVKKHNPSSAELYVMGVLPNYHRQGIGREMVKAIETRLRAVGISFLQVKTLDASRANDAYDKTRMFYASQDFVPLEVFPTLWGENNPCVQMVKAL
ncbi:MAG: GNAT family N-acetyltransferase [Pseudomonadota bacterium]|jgi:ribosomal protein S18 acetylase RimI-like enzyme|nr:GNAT family N-acetyltransferase [Alphaproteobacteria bacterium]MCS5596078.1 GNAT family N-acetyltransferase [Alphaproteobacteria bacterium]MEC7701901.1 GNAT family N-acetyltransferase [Pseudomonadota bacterium]MED5424056.1 GNAT family N-acetyltransferase [Pseudomonadota bacterium]|tara:strand:+ start:5293 stop:5757 length:465 start_codon:yes stop_codon:yes gene_type:complete